MENEITERLEVSATFLVSEKVGGGSEEEEMELVKTEASVNDFSSVLVE